MSNYDLLGVSSNASAREIRKAYHEKIKQYHPDSYQGDADFAREKTQDIVEAYKAVIQDAPTEKIEEPVYEYYDDEEDYEEESVRAADPDEEPFNIWEEVHMEAERERARKRAQDMERRKKQEKADVSMKDLLLHNHIVQGALVTAVLLILIIADLIHTYREPADLKGLYFTQVQEESGVQNLYIRFDRESSSKGIMRMYVMTQDENHATYLYTFPYEAWNRKQKTLFSKLQQHLAPEGDHDVRYAKIEFREGTCVGLDENVQPLDVSGRDTGAFTDVIEYDGARLYFQGYEMDLVDRFYEADIVPRSLLDHYEDAINK